ncbi:type I-B CRISPR-associated protein Cas5b [Senegalia massiliensis]|uniref:type I-B CRISPR-associated protein Cas5b n=1 Tax=Senegalia massiliensis TaxID=1720316 RepID=UPI001030E836|nr:type I-B CRISPR-associated protein Cas5b [Senegalia massiliensis]
MEALKFNIKGSTAFFKKPDVNAYAYFSYGNIPKIALLGILGSILGLGGYNQQKEDEIYPEFYEKLKDLKVSIIPNTKKAYFAKKIQVFNNSVGYASKEQGGNLIVREQWLENVNWTIYILNDGNIDKNLYNKLNDYLLNNKTHFIPYLGKNDHPANIMNVAYIKLEEVKSYDKIDSLFPYKDVKLGKGTSDGKLEFLYKEYLPVSLNKELNFYELEELSFTNYRIKEIDHKDRVYSDKEKNLYFI